eukprot:7055829-Ditylum_brightwellii.AAC.1
MFISTITREDNNKNAQKDDTKTKEVSNDNTHSTASSSQESTKLAKDTSESESKSKTVKEGKQVVQIKKKSGTPTKAVFIQQRQLAQQAKERVHFEGNPEDPGKTA